MTFDPEIVLYKMRTARRRAHELTWHDIDNVAILFQDEAAEKSFVSLVCGAWEEFFQSDDSVIGHIGAEAYDVHFRFLRRKGSSDPFRIETMQITDGHSTVHQHLLDMFGNGAIAHASYKPNPALDTIRSYQEETLRLSNSGFEMVNAWHAIYGMYSYWQPQPVQREQGNPRLPRYGYLKVRHNWRDK